MMNNIMGMDGFVWWFGVIENRMDPLKTGRCQVRVYYWNEDSKTTLPTEQLIWAHPILPLNVSTVQVPHEGTMVFGFYMDGKQANNPMMMGWVPGIPDQAPPDPSFGFTDPRTQDQLQSAPRPPQNINYNTSGTGATIQEASAAQRYPYQLNEPTTSRLSRNENIQDTIIGQRQNSLVTQIPVGTGAVVMGGIDLQAALGSQTFQITFPALQAGLNLAGSFEVCGIGISAALGINAGLLLNGITLTLPSISLMAGLNLGVDLFGCLIAGTKIGGAIQIDGGTLLQLLPPNKFINVREIGNRNTVYGGVQLGTMGGIPLTSQPMWDEPTPPYNAQYPYNSAYQSESGHVFEIDDTPGYERINTNHRSGTFTEMQPDGSQLTKVTKNAYQITMADHNTLAMGDHNTTVQGRQTNLVQQDSQNTIDGTETRMVKSDSTTTILGNRTTTVAKDSQETILQNKLVNVKGSETIVIEGDKNELIQGNYNLTVQGNVNLSIGQNWTIQVIVETDMTSPTINIIANDLTDLTTPIFNITGDTFMNGNLDVTGHAIGGSGTGDSVNLQTHTHTQGSDSHGDTERPTNSPTPGT